MLARSPITRVEAIRTPLLIADYLVFPDEGYRLVNPENKIAFQCGAERFLARHLGGREHRG